MSIDTMSGMHHRLLCLDSNLTYPENKVWIVCRQTGNGKYEGMESVDAYKHCMIVHIPMRTVIMKVYESRFRCEVKFLTHSIGGKEGNKMG